MWDNGVTVVLLFFAAMPGFWLVLVAIMLFGLKLECLQATGMEYCCSYILKVFTNALTSVANMARMAR